MRIIYSNLINRLFLFAVFVILGNKRIDLVLDHLDLLIVVIMWVVIMILLWYIRLSREWHVIAHTYHIPGVQSTTHLHWII